MTYKLEIKTADSADAGTSAKATITVVWSSGDRTVLHADGAAGYLDSGALDVLTFDAGPFQNPGAPVAIELSHDDSGAASGWFVCYVRVFAPGGKWWRADFQRWLATDERDGSLHASARLRNHSRWMGDLHDHFGTISSRNEFGEVPLHQLPMAGTHDSGTYGMGKGAMAQDATILEQLGLGVRFFDLRPRAYGGKFYVQHTLGSDNVLVNYGQATKFAVNPGDGSIFNDIRDFLAHNPNEVIILKFQTFSLFDAEEHDDFRQLIAAYFSLIPQGPVENLTLNNIRNGAGRVIVFYGDDLGAAAPYDASWYGLWPYRVAQEQRSVGYVSLLDPWWEDDIGASGGDDDQASFARTWQPYHEANLVDWASRSPAFFVTQAQMQVLHGELDDRGRDNAYRNNGRNIAMFMNWVKMGVPRQVDPSVLSGAPAPVLRPNIMTLDFVEYGHETLGSLTDAIVDYFLSISPPMFSRTYDYDRFNTPFIPLPGQQGVPVLA